MKWHCVLFVDKHSLFYTQILQNGKEYTDIFLRRLSSLQSFQYLKEAGPSFFQFFRIFMFVLDLYFFSISFPTLTVCYEEAGQKTPELGFSVLTLALQKYIF